MVTPPDFNRGHVDKQRGAVRNREVDAGLVRALQQQRRHLRTRGEDADCSSSGTRSLLLEIKLHFG